MSLQNIPMNKEDKVPKYEKIALDIAFSIVNGEWKVGEMVTGRSTLAGNTPYPRDNQEVAGTSGRARGDKRN